MDAATSQSVRVFMRVCVYVTDLCTRYFEFQFTFKRNENDSGVPSKGTISPACTAKAPRNPKFLLPIHFLQNLSEYPNSTDPCKAQIYNKAAALNTAPRTITKQASKFDCNPNVRSRQRNLIASSPSMPGPHLSRPGGPNRLSSRMRGMMWAFELFASTYLREPCFLLEGMMQTMLCIS